MTEPRPLAEVLEETIANIRKREAVAKFLAKRYNGVIPVTEEMIDAVIKENGE